MLPFKPDGIRAHRGNGALGEGENDAGEPWREQAPSGPAQLAALLVEVGHGDKAAFRALYDRTSAKLFGVCVRILRERQEAEEALQDAYVTVWQRAGSYDIARGSAMTWLITVARNRTLDRLRATGRLSLAPMDLATSVPDPAISAHAVLLLDEEARRLAGCMDELDAGDAILIRAGFIEGSTYSALAARAAQPLGTIKSRIRRALLKLKACLQ